MTTFNKFGKSTKDLLTKGFLDDKEDKQERRRIEFNGVALNGDELQFIAKQLYKDDSVEGSLKHTHVFQDLKTETEFKTDNVSFTLTDDKHVDGLVVKVNVEGSPEELPKLFAKKGDDSAPTEGGDEAATKSDLKLGAYIDIEYKRNVAKDVDVATTFKASREKKDGSNNLDISVAASHSCGGSFGVQYKAPANNFAKSKELAVGFQFVEKDLTLNGSYNVKGNGDDKTSSVKFGAYHKFNSSTQWAAEGVLPVKGDDKRELRAVIQRDCGGERYKLRVAVPTGRLAGSYSTKLGAHTDFVLAGEGNLVNVFTGKGTDQKISSKIVFNAK